MRNKIASLFFCIIELFFRSNNDEKIKIDDFPEEDDFMKEIGGKLVIIPITKNTSTTKIINKIK